MKTIAKLAKRRQQLRRKKIDDTSLKLINFNKFIVLPNER